MGRAPEGFSPAGVRARKYAMIWTPDGSPLRVYHDRQVQLLRGYLGAVASPAGATSGRGRA